MTGGIRPRALPLLVALFATSAVPVTAQQHAPAPAPPASAPATHAPAPAAHAPASPAQRPVPATQTAAPATPPPAPRGDSLVETAARINARIAALRQGDPQARATRPAATVPRAAARSARAPQPAPALPADHVNLTWRANLLWPIDIDPAGLPASPEQPAPLPIQLSWPGVDPTRP